MKGQRMVAKGYDGAVGARVGEGEIDARSKERSPCLGPRISSRLWRPNKRLERTGLPALCSASDSVGRLAICNSMGYSLQA